MAEIPRPSRKEERLMTARGTPQATVHALAEPTRMRIVELLREGPLSVGAIADRLGLRQPQTSKHLKVLAEGGIVDVTIDANRRIYALRPEPFVALDAWLQAFRPLMEERFDNLDAHLRALRDERSRDR
jgi:DNA-binding transcriptional ArsR family regulator